MDESPNPKELRKKIEPWLTALFQSEHLSLFLGSGISFAARQLAKENSATDAAGQLAEENLTTDLDKIEFSVFQDEITQASEASAEKSDRGQANIEDQIRVCNELIRGLKIYTCCGIASDERIQEKIEGSSLL